MDIGNEIIAAGLVDEFLEFERMKQEIIKLKSVINSKGTVCIYCHSEMRSFYKKDYYSETVGWMCECDDDFIEKLALDSGNVYRGPFT